MDKAQAHQLLKDVLSELWKTESRGILGSRLKTALVTEAYKRGSEFDEKLLGHESFTGFLTESGVAALKFRRGTDVLVAPIDNAQDLEASESHQLLRPHVRADFWSAFVSYEVVGQTRAYDPAKDAILVSPPAAISAEAIPITPIRRDSQVAWRKAFIDSLGAESPLVHVRESLEQPSGLRAFSQVLAAHPELRERWRDYFVQQVVEVIRAWASPNGVSDDTWIDSVGGEGRSRPVRAHGLSSDELRRDESIRTQIYRVLDTIPVEHLAKLSIPIEWLIDRRR